VLAAVAEVTEVGYIRGTTDYAEPLTDFERTLTGVDPTVCRHPECEAKVKTGARYCRRHTTCATVLRTKQQMAEFVIALRHARETGETEAIVWLSDG